MKDYENKFILYLEEIDMIKEFSNEEVGMLIRALAEYVRDKTVSPLPEKLIFVFRFMSAHIDRDKKRYEEISEKRSIAGKKGQEAKRKAMAQLEEYTVSCKNNAVLKIEAVEKNQSPDGEETAQVFNGEETAQVFNGEENSITIDTAEGGYVDNDNENSVKAWFEEFWESYPKKQDKESAKKAYLKLNPTIETHSVIMESLKKHKKTDEWKREDGRFIPHPAKWIACKRWEDKISVSTCVDDSGQSFDIDDFVKAAIKKSEMQFQNT